MALDNNRESNDPFNLRRFVEAQSSCFAEVEVELAAGRKRSHWMWFIFPQLEGLGSSAMAQRFAISGVEEANAYLLHATLGERLRECVALVNKVEGHAIEEIFDYPDDLKFHSSITLFAWVVEHSHNDQTSANRVFREALTRYFDNRPDAATISRLQR